jgi:hypothetical protein
MQVATEDDENYLWAIGRRIVRDRRLALIIPAARDRRSARVTVPFTDIVPLWSGRAHKPPKELLQTPDPAIEGTPRSLRIGCERCDTFYECSEPVPRIAADEGCADLVRPMALRQMYDLLKARIGENNGVIAGSRYPPPWERFA